MDPDVVDILPATWPFTSVGKALGDFPSFATVSVANGRVLREARDFLPASFVRPSCQCHRSSAEKQFTVGGGRGTSKPTRLHFAKFGNPQGL